MLEELDSRLISNTQCPFREPFPKLFSLAQGSAGSVFSHSSNDGQNIKASELIQKEIYAKRKELIHLLPRHFQLDMGARDRPIWVWDSKMAIRSPCCRLNDAGLHCLFANVIWGIKTPLKIKVLASA